MNAITTALALCFATAAQEPQPAQEPTAPPAGESPAPRPGGPDWLQYDGVVAQAGNDVITYSFMLAELEARAPRLTTIEERNDAFTQLLFLELLGRLETQAGEDEKIFAEDQVENIIENFLARRREQHGIVGYTEQVVEEGLDPLNEKDRHKESLYRDVWRKAGLIGPRPTRDEFLRPGELRAFYRMQLPNLGEPDRVQLQILVISNAALAGENAPPAAARPLCEDSRKRLIAGDATFPELVEEFGVTLRDSQGVTPPEVVTKLSPEERAFVDGAEIGAISEVLPVRLPTRSGEAGEPIAWEVVKLLVREEGAPAPGFTDRTIQRRLRVVVEEDRSKKRLAEGRIRLQNRAHVWINPAYDRSSEEPPAAAAQEP